jgi:hypothetical protein
VVKTPPSRGPAIEAMPYIEPIMPLYIGRLAKGIECATMIKAPEKIPAEPRPAMARPIIRAIEFGAVAHSKLPSSKIAMATRKTVLMEKKV